MIKSVLNLDAARGLTYRILTDYAAYSSWVPGCSRSTVLSSDGTRAQTELVLAGMKTVTVVLAFDAAENLGIRFELVRSADLKDYRGEYRLMDAANGKGTVLISEVEMDAGTMVPRFMLDRMIRKALEDMGKALQARVKTVQAEPAIPEGPAHGSHLNRPRRLLQIANTASGIRIWYLGRLYDPRGR
jgi:hypothetical protein